MTSWFASWNDHDDGKVNREMRFSAYCERLNATRQAGRRGMSVRMSVSLPDDLAQTIKILSHHYKSQSVFVETALRRFISQIRREEQQQRDIEIINRHADQLNAETLDALRYQIPL